MKNEIVFAAFRVDEEKSIFYRKYKTMKGFLGSLKAVIESQRPDYISIRVIKKDE